MEGTLAFLDSNIELITEDIHAAVIWHLKVVDACHNTWEVVVRCVRRLTWLADHSKHGRETLESYASVSITQLSSPRS